MSENQAIIVGEVREIGPALPVASVVKRYQQMATFAAEAMRPDVDFGHIPGVDKPSLFKPGAEKLTVLFGLEARFALIDRVERWNDPIPFFFYRYECALYHRETGVRMANAFGSCNSREKKYRWRRVPSWEATTEDEKNAVRVEERVSKKGNPVKFYILENPELCDLVNTFDKMAQKRALVAAVLVGTGASEFFTQDVEDMTEGEHAGPVGGQADQRDKRILDEALARQQQSGNGHVSPADWLSKHSKIIFACRQAHAYLTPQQIAERLSTLGVDPALGEGAAVEALGGKPSVAPAVNAVVSDGGITPDLAENWLRELKVKVVSAHNGREPSEKMVKFAVVLLNQCFDRAGNQEARDIARHQFLTLVNGEQSLNKWTFGEVKVLIDELTMTAEDGKSVLDTIAAGYVRQLVEGANVAAGQLDLFAEVPMPEVTNA